MRRWRDSSSRMPPAKVLAGLACLLAVLIALPVPPVLAHPAVTPARIVVEDVLAQGDHVSLPPLHVRNRGVDVTTFQVKTISFNDDTWLTPFEEWFTFDPSRVELNPGERGAIAVRLRIPRDALPGRYRVLLQVAGEQAAAGPAATVRATVATNLTFEVERRYVSWLDPLLDILRRWAPFSHLGLGILAVVGTIAWIRRRFDIGIGIRIERRA